MLHNCLILRSSLLVSGLRERPAIMGNLVVGEREHPMDRTRLTTAQVLIIIAVVALVVALALLEALAGREHAVDTDRTWESAIAKLDSALERGDTTGAIRAWHDAYLAAFVSRRWEGMVEVGDAAVRIGAIARSSEYWQPRAREAYLAAMFRARAHHSLEGVLRAAEGFGALWRSACAWPGRSRNAMRNPRRAWSSSRRTGTTSSWCSVTRGSIRSDVDDERTGTPCPPDGTVPCQPSVRIFAATATWPGSAQAKSTSPACSGQSGGGLNR
jgi:hypothetical protein